MSSPGFSLDSLDPQTLQKLAELLKQQQPSTPFSGAGNAGNKLLQAYLLKQGQPQMMSSVMQMAPKMFGFGQ